MGLKQGDKADRWITAASIFVTLVGVLVVYALHAPDRWIAAVFCTVVVFSGMISLYRNQWRFLQFWLLLGMAFFIHLAVFYWLFSRTFNQTSSIPLLLCVPFVFLEAGLIYFALRIVEAKLGTRLP